LLAINNNDNDDDNDVDCAITQCPQLSAHIGLQFRTVQIQTEVPSFIIQTD